MQAREKSSPRECLGSEVAGLPVMVIGKVTLKVGLFLGGCVIASAIDVNMGWRYSPMLLSIYLSLCMST